MTTNPALHHYLFEHDVLFRLAGDQPVHHEESVPVVTPPVPVPVVKSEKVPTSPFHQLKSRLLIIVETYGKGIKPEERAFLTKVLKAVHYDLEKVDLLELDRLASRDASVVITEKLADYVLLFGVKPEMANLRIQLNLFEPAQHDGIWFLMSNSLVRIEMEESKRRDLWNALKKMFF